jgi:hypothetical protein
MTKNWSMPLIDAERMPSQRPHSVSRKIPTDTQIWTTPTMSRNQPQSCRLPKTNWTPRA